MTCKDCLHYEVCYIIEHYGADETENGQEYDCYQFKDRTKWVEQKRGRWILNDDGSGTCKNCHRTTKKSCWDYDHWMNYCPNCGAKMDGRE